MDPARPALNDDEHQDDEEESTVAEQQPVPWALLAADAATVARYRAKVYDRGPDRCAYYLGAISSSGHGKLRAGSRKTDTSRVVTAHVLGFVIAYGAQALTPGAVVRHRCDESSCQQPTHWTSGERLDNIRDYYARSHRAGHALGDVRGPDGRAVAIREAILTAQANGADVEAAIAAAIAAGNPSGASQDALF
ncbi:hypothetical protein ACFWW5_20980 [Streptomyces albidoflavus]|uniref:hypothetical protein n=1 Tax=Streptomyces albidoflavus TaxID=1886 RepID=UPI003409007E